MRNKPDIKAERLSLRKAALDLGTDCRWLSGYIQAMGIEPLPIGNALTITRHEVERIRRRRAAGAQANPQPCGSAT